MKNHIGLFITILTILPLCSLWGQSNSASLEAAQKLHSQYKFEQALSLYRAILDKTTDSLTRVAIERKMALSENGLSLLSYGYEPKVVAKKHFLKGDFFLHYPGLEDNCWMECSSNMLNGEAGQKSLFYFENGAESLYYSAKSEEGSWDIYRIDRLNDTLWSVPVALENINSAGDEIFPLVSRDGKSLYFSSNGHYGVGGYDLYVSEWDEKSQDWGVPQNLGFPYSSPQNDYLFYNTPDGNFTLFSSDRETDADSVAIYALLFENMPLKKSITSEQAAKIALLSLSGEGKEEAESVRKEADNIDDSKYSEYSVAVERVKEIEKRLNATLKQQQQSRDLYNTLKNPDDLRALEKRIGELELEVIGLQEQARVAAAKLQEIEMDFLSQGIFFQAPIIEQKGSESKEQTLLPTFAFAENNLGILPKMTILEPVPAVDLTFRVEKEPQELIDIKDFPNGLVYQIQLYTLSRPISNLKLLKGLTPVFERKISGRYSYSVGAFSTYSEANSNLNKVKRLGFSSAIVRAYNNGEYINTTRARALEQQQAENKRYQVVIDGYSDALPSEILTVVRSNTNKDIAKIIEGGATKYVVGTFSKQEEAQMLAAAIKVVSDQEITVKEVE